MGNYPTGACIFRSKFSGGFIPDTIHHQIEFCLWGDGLWCRYGLGALGCDIRAAQIIRLHDQHVFDPLRLTTERSAKANCPPSDHQSANIAVFSVQNGFGFAHRVPAAGNRFCQCCNTERDIIRYGDKIALRHGDIFSKAAFAGGHGNDLTRGA